MSADNRILQDQLQMKVIHYYIFEFSLVLRSNPHLTVFFQLNQISENAEIQETVLMLRHQLNSLLDKSSDNQNQTAESEVYSLGNFSAESSKPHGGWDEASLEETNMDENTPKSALSLSGKFLQEDFRGSNCDASLKSQVLMQVFFSIWLESEFSFFFFLNFCVSTLAQSLCQFHVLPSGF